MERSHIGTIEMRMRKQNEIDGWECVPFQGGFRQALGPDGQIAEANAEARKKHWIREDGDA